MVLRYVIYKAQSNVARLFMSLVNNWRDYGGRVKCISWAQAAGKNVTADDDFYSNVVCRRFTKIMSWYVFQIKNC
jgi:mannan endo-1,4-beta-mannosidase